MKNTLFLQISHSVELDTWISENHYLQSTPAGSKLRMEFFDACDRRIGAMLWGRPVARNLEQDTLLQLTRMYFIDDTMPFVESQALGMARKYIRKHCPTVKGLITYSSLGKGHEGIVYKADNWYPLGITKKASWEGRSGRTDRDMSEKIRWTRSP